MSIGNRVYLKRNLPSEELVQRFKKLPAANVADCMNRISALSPEIKLQSSPKARMCGPALTIRARGGDNLMLHQALNMAGENDIIVFSNEGDRSRAIMGEIMYKYLADFKKVGGIIIDGAIRDIDVISKCECPIYATGTTPGGPFKEGPGEVNVPIAISSIAIMPGDIILGDEDGVIVIPQKDAADLIEKAEANAEADHAKVLKASKGTANREWVTKTLEAKNVEFIDDVYA